MEVLFMDYIKFDLSPCYPDYWRRYFFYPACNSGKKIALIGAGDFNNYLKYDWGSVNYKGFDVLYLHYHSKGKYSIFDISEESITSLREYQINATVLDVSKSILPEKFDYIFAADVIEHTDSPVQFLKNIAGSLNADGIVVITTPNADYWRNAIQFRLREEPTHWCCFSKRNLENLARRLSLEIIMLKDFRTSSPFMKDYSWLKELWHQFMGRLFSHNSLIYCFKNKG